MPCQNTAEANMLIVNSKLNNNACEFIGTTKYLLDLRPDLILYPLEHNDPKLKLPIDKQLKMAKMEHWHYLSVQMRFFIIGSFLVNLF